MLEDIVDDGMGEGQGEGFGESLGGGFDSGFGGDSGPDPGEGFGGASGPAFGVTEFCLPDYKTWDYHIQGALSGRNPEDFRDIGLGLVHHYSGIGGLHPSVNPFLDNFRYNNGLPGGVPYETSYQILYGDGGGGGGLDILNRGGMASTAPSMQWMSATGSGEESGTPASEASGTELLPGEWRGKVEFPSSMKQGSAPDQSWDREITSEGDNSNVDLGPYGDHMTGVWKDMPIQDANALAAAGALLVAQQYPLAAFTAGMYLKGKWDQIKESESRKLK